MRHHRIAALVASAVIVALAVVSAQSSLGNIRGVVQDSAGAVVPGAQIGLSGDGTPESRSAITDANGQFAFAGVAPGRYTVTAALAGFTTASVKADVQAGATLTLSLSLRVASLPETISVTAQSPQCQHAFVAPARIRLHGGRIQHRSVRPHHRQRMDQSVGQAAVDVLHRRRHRVVRQRPPLPERGSGCRPRDAVRDRRAGQLLHVRLPEPRDGAPFARHDRDGRLPVERQPPARADRPPGTPHRRQPDAAAQPRVPDRRVRLDGRAEQAAAGQGVAGDAGRRT